MMTRFSNTLFILLATFILFSSCEDVVDVPLDEGTPQLTVDAWLTHTEGEQTIRLTRTQPYFNNQNATPAIEARVNVTDNEGNTFEFIDNKNGDYTWTAPEGERFGKMGNQYFLTVEFEGETYAAVSSINRVPEIDSITFEFEEEELGQPEGYYAEFFARDFIGVNDAYWIRTYKNTEFLGKPAEINIAYDAGFSPGGGIDGLIFITPIRQAINRIPDSGDAALDTDEVPPYAINDSIYVEIYSITPEAFFFLEELQIQTTNSGIFAEPPANVRTNILNVNQNSDKKAVGFFCTSAVSGLGKRLRE